MIPDYCESQINHGFYFLKKSKLKEKLHSYTSTVNTQNNHYDVGWKERKQEILF